MGSGGGTGAIVRELASGREVERTERMVKGEKGHARGNRRSA